MVLLNKIKKLYEYSLRIGVCLTYLHVISPCFNVILIILFTFCAGVESFTFYRKSGSKWATRRLNEPLYLDFSKAAHFWAAFNFQICQFLLCICSYLEYPGRGCPVISCFIMFLFLLILSNFTMYQFHLLRHTQIRTDLNGFKRNKHHF